MASGTHYWTRETVNSPAGGTTPLSLDNHISFTASHAGDSLLRTILDIEMFVLVSGTGTGVLVKWWQEVFIMVGVWWENESPAPSVSPIPITDVTALPDWVIWNRLTPHVEIDDISSPTQTVFWRSLTGQIDVSSKRTDFAKNGSRVWLAYEIFDAVGVINTTVSSMTYDLGYNASLACLFKSAV